MRGQTGSPAAAGATAPAPVPLLPTPHCLPTLPAQLAARLPACRCRPAPPPSTRAPPAPTQSSASQSRPRVGEERGSGAVGQGRAVPGTAALLQFVATCLTCCMTACMHQQLQLQLHTQLHSQTTCPHALLPAPLKRSRADRADALTDPNARLGRTLSFLHLIDLAGSESAKVRCMGGVGRVGG